MQLVNAALRVAVVRGGLVCLPAFVVACAGTESGPANVTRDSAGVAIVESRRAVWDSSTAWQVPAEPSLRLGSASGADTTTSFTQVAGALRLDDGTIVVMDQVSAELRWFDTSGRLLHVNQLRGPGPGQVRFVTDMNRLPADTILIDGGVRPAKSLFFAPTGTFVREELMDDTTFRSLGRWGECPGFIAPDRSHVVCQVIPGQAPLPPDPEPGHLRYATQVVRVSPDLATVDTLGLNGGTEQFLLERGKDAPLFVAHPFYSRSHFVAGGDPMRIAIGANPAYRIEIWRPGHGLERVILGRRARRVPTALERDSANVTLRRMHPDADEATMNTLLRLMPVPDSLPAIADLLFSRRGELLVTREGMLAGQAQTIVDVFDAEGRLLGTLPFPPRVRLRDVGSDYILASRTDDTGAQVVELYELRRPGS